MPYNTYFKPKTTPEERAECFEWFERHMDRLPQQIELPGMTIRDLPRFVNRSIRSLKIHIVQSSLFEGQFSLLQFVRAKLRQDPDFEEK